MKKYFTSLLAALMVFSLAACGNSNLSPSMPDESQASGSKTPDTADASVMIDSAGREVELPNPVKRIVCVNVGALRYTCYMQAQDLVVGVEDYEQEATMARLYNYVNFSRFSALPVIGTNGAHDPEAIIQADPDVIIMTSSSKDDADALQQKTNIPVVVVPGSDAALDDGAYETLRRMGEVYGKEDRANELISYMDSIKADLHSRTANVPEADKPTVYVGGVSFKGHHGFAGTEANYGPLSLIHAKNLADEAGRAGAFQIDLEKVLAWDPDYIFVDFNGMDLIKKDYASNPDYYNSLTAVKTGKVYSQISFRSSAANLETALADAYCAASVIYPQQFKDVNPVEKAGEIFKTFLGTNPYNDLKEAGYEFRAVTIGE